MNEFTVWIQNNWYELGTLLSEFVFLSAGIWFARKILKTMRASQEQVGALLKLSVTGGTAERPSANAPAEKSLASASPYWLTPSEVPAVAQQEQVEQGPGRLAVAGRSTLDWLRTPMNNRRRVAPWRKAIRWLQSPAGN
jgi:hypothetical protein